MPQTTHREVSPELGPDHPVGAVGAAHLTPHNAVFGSVLERLRLLCKRSKKETQYETQQRCRARADGENQTTDKGLHIGGPVTPSPPQPPRKQT